jgi:hypothetical protein
MDTSRNNADHRRLEKATASQGTLSDRPLTLQLMASLTVARGKVI